MTATALAIANTRIVQIRRMWEGGPLRNWTERATSVTRLKYSGAIGGYVGAYLCEGCGQVSDGVYQSRGAEQKWLCGACK